MPHNENRMLQENKQADIHASTYHIPVLLKESVEALITRKEGVYIDATLGGGGHSTAILENLGPKGHLYGFDQDADAKNNAPLDSRFTFVASNFRYIRYWMDYYGIGGIDGLIADLGVSSHHFDTPDRGFSFRFEEAIPDMRMNRLARLSAKEYLQEANEERLTDIFRAYGELTDAARLAQIIVSQRAVQPLDTMRDLLACLAVALPKHPQQRHRKLSRIFQALRIAINDEMGALRELLDAAGDLLLPGGRLVILTYHSLEDRIVKKWIQRESLAEGTEEERLIYGTRPGKMKAVKGFSSKPNKDEIARNTRASSANMRIAERLP